MDLKKRVERLEQVLTARGSLPPEARYQVIDEREYPDIEGREQQILDELGAKYGILPAQLEGEVLFVILTDFTAGFQGQSSPRVGNHHPGDNGQGAKDSIDG